MGGAALGFGKHVVQRYLHAIRNLPVATEREPLLAETVILSVRSVTASFVKVPLVGDIGSYWTSPSLHHLGHRHL